MCCARGGERGDVGTHGKGKPPAPCVVRERANDESGMVVRLQPHTHSPGTRGEVKPVVRRGSSRSRGGRRTAQQHYDHTHDARSANDARPVNQAAGEAQRATEAAATAEKPASERASLITIPRMHGGGESTAQYTHNDERHGTAPTTHGRTDDERARREQGEGGHTQHEEKHNNTARDATTNDDDEDSTATRARLHSLVTFGPTRACMGGTRTGDVLTVHSNLPVLLTKTSPRSSQRKGHERNTTRDETRRDETHTPYISSLRITRRR